ncbi:MAG: M20 family metallo-hydrolase [Deferribacteraceae bacterium]|jgi:N-carbamoyl-L-amino-acid hydrolase|nr:M20 family metallo-hydrolase [Deferribacteraceae bacterium]
MNDVALLDKWFAILDNIGVNDDGSTSRMGYTDVEDAMIAAVVKIGSEYGLKHCVDEVGNTFIYNGTGEGDYTLIGSHLDSVLQGGKFDGIAGVLAGMLILKKLQDEKLDIPVKVGIFRMEESSVFGIATVGSKLVTGNLTEASLKKATNADNTSLYDIMIGRGYKANPAKITKLKQYLELHIEQGRVLEVKGLTLGVVNSIAAPVRMWVKFTGNQDHSGATPMDLRKDSLVAAAELIVAVEQFGKAELANASVATVGIVRNTPNVFNVVPGETTLGIDIRGIDKASRERVLQNTEAKAQKIATEGGLGCSISRVSESDPVKLDDTLCAKLSKTAEKLGIAHLVMPSGAGHDAMNFTEICPVGMLFIPCKEGISHNKDELAKTEDIARGSDVLLEYLKNMKIKLYNHQNLS